MVANIGAKSRVIAAVATVLLLSLSSLVNAGAVVRGTVIEQQAFTASGRYSWLVAVINTVGGTRCTGVLIDPSWVLTAGHCLPADTVLSGSNDLLTAARSSVDSSISFQPDGGAGQELTADAGLLHLTSPLTATPAPLLSQDSAAAPVGAAGTVAGWGITPARTTLAHEGTVLVVEVAGAFLLTEPAPGSPCSGDSGGPLLVGGVVAGITNFGEAGCLGLSGYSRLSVISSWIDSIVSGQPASADQLAGDLPTSGRTRDHRGEAA